MPSLKEVKSRIGSVTSTQQITKAMKMVAASKLRRAQESIIRMRPYAQKLNEILQNVSLGLEKDQSQGYTEVREVDRVLIVVITSDRGLCGAFNSNVCKRAVAHIKQNYSSEHKSGDLQVLSVGKKGRDYFRKRGYPIVDEFTEMFVGLSFDKSRKATEWIMQAYANLEFDKVDIVYNEFKNVATQVLCVENFLPLQGPDEGEDTIAIDYIFQPNKQVIVEEMVPKSLRIQLYKAILESNAAEHGARMTAMDQATENAGELLRDLHLSYNRTRQAAITKEILEIVGGAEALA